MWKVATVNYMVQQLGPLAKTCETAKPTSFQAIEFLPSSVLQLTPPCCAKSLSRQFTKSEGVNPSILCALTEVTKVFVMSKRVSASATCSLGFCTENHIQKKKIKRGRFCKPTLQNSNS